MIFGAVDEPLEYCIVLHFSVNGFILKLVLKFGMVERDSISILPALVDVF